MRDSNSALSHHFYQVARAELISDVPAEAEDADRMVEMAAMEEGWWWELMHIADYQSAVLFAPEPIRPLAKVTLTKREGCKIVTAHKPQTP